MSNVFIQGRIKAQVEDKVVGRLLGLQLRGAELFDRLDDERYLAIVEKLKDAPGPFPKGAAGQENHQDRIPRLTRAR